MRTLQDRQVEVFIGQVLRTGVLLSAGMTLIGFVLYLMRYTGAPPHYLTFIASRGGFYSPSTSIHRSVAGDAEAIMQAGILLLIATPVARVAFLIGAFALQRDRLYVGVSSLVLLVLLFSLLFMR